MPRRAIWSGARSRRSKKKKKQRRKLTTKLKQKKLKHAADDDASDCSVREAARGHDCENGEGGGHNGDWCNGAHRRINERHMLLCSELRGH